METTNTELLQQLCFLDSVPSFLQQDFEVWSAQSKHAARELLLMLLHLGLNVNYIDSKGFSPLQKAILGKNKRLVEILLGRPELDLNLRCQNDKYRGETAVHLAVRGRDYDMAKSLLEFKGIDKVELGLKNQ